MGTRRLILLALFAALLVAMSAPAEAGFTDWLRRVFGRRYEYIAKLVAAQAMYLAPGPSAMPSAPPAPAISPIDTGLLMLVDLGTTATSQLPGAPAASWSPIAVSPTEIAYLAGSGQYADQHDAGLWIYSRDSQQVRPVVLAQALDSGTGFYTLVEPPTARSNALIVVLRRVETPPGTIYRIADLETGKLEAIPDAPDEPVDPAASGNVRELLAGSRIREGAEVKAVGAAPTTPQGARDIVTWLPTEGGLGRSSYRTVVHGGPWAQTDNFDPHWLSDSEIVYVARPWPQPTPVALPTAPVPSAVPAPPAQP